MDPADRPILEVERLGRVEYQAALALQRERVRERALGAVEDRLLLLEHEPVITVGRAGRAQAAVLAGLPVVFVERGGEATYHGPGQLVGYPILLLRPGEQDVRRYLRSIEQALILALSDLGVAASRREPYTGVWVGGRKIASIGVAIRRWVTFHGFALNVRTDLRAFSGFSPCGLPPAVMTSLAALGNGSSLEAAAERVAVRFAEACSRRLVEAANVADSCVRQAMQPAVRTALRGSGD